MKKKEILVVFVLAVLIVILGLLYQRPGGQRDLVDYSGATCRGFPEPFFATAKSGLISRPSVTYRYFSLFALSFDLFFWFASFSFLLVLIKRPRVIIFALLSLVVTSLLSFIPLCGAMTGMGGLICSYGLPLPISNQPPFSFYFWKYFGKIGFYSFWMDFLFWFLSLMGGWWAVKKLRR